MLLGGGGRRTQRPIRADDHHGRSVAVIPFPGGRRRDDRGAQPTGNSVGQPGDEVRLRRAEPARGGPPVHPDQAPHLCVGAERGPQLMPDAEVRHEELAPPDAGLRGTAGVQVEDPHGPGPRRDIAEQVDVVDLVLQVGELRVPGVAEVDVVPPGEQPRRRVAGRQAHRVVGHRLAQQVQDGFGVLGHPEPGSRRHLDPPAHLLCMRAGHRPIVGQGAPRVHPRILGSEEPWFLGWHPPACAATLVVPAAPSRHETRRNP